MYLPIKKEWWQYLLTKNFLMNPEKNKIHYYLNSNICVAVAYYRGIEIRIHDDHILILNEKGKVSFILGQEFLQRNEILAVKLYDAIKNEVKNDKQNNIGKIIKILT